MQVSLNVSARDLLDTGLAELDRPRAASAMSLPPEALLLEIDERVLTSEPAHAVATAEALAALGVALSLDDFGTGYSSLVRLKRLPVSEVKIDSSFVARLLAAPPTTRSIVQSIVDLVRGARHPARWPRAWSPPTGRDRAAAHGLRRRAGLVLRQPLNAASATAWLAEHGAGRRSGQRRPRAARSAAPARPAPARASRTAAPSAAAPGSRRPALAHRAGRNAVGPPLGRP